VATSPARKILIPLSQDPVEVVGITRAPLPHLIEELVCENLKSFLQM